MRVLIAILTLTTALAATAAEGPMKDEFQIAQPAPAFALKSLQGKEVKLADYDGKAVLVCFFASWDKPCQKHLPVLADLQRQYGMDELQVLGIALEADNLGPLRAYLQSQKIAFPVLLFDLKVVQDFGGITSIPTTFVIDKNHNIIRKHVGWQEKDMLDADLKAVLKK